MTMPGGLSPERAAPGLSVTPTKEIVVSSITSPCAPAEANKRIVADYYLRVWNAKDASALAQFVAADYIQHNPHVPNGRAPLEAFLAGFFAHMPGSSFSVARLVAEGDIVVAHCLFKANDADRGTAVVDVYRIADGMLAEHWDVKEPVPETSANGNPMV